MPKPRLTSKVLTGLSAILDAVYAGDMLQGDLKSDAEAVESARAWVRAMQDHRAARARERHHGP